MVKYTTATIVKARLNNRTSASTADIEAIIDQCEGYIDVALKIPSTFSFNASTIRHLALRRISTDLAALYVLGMSSMSFQTLGQAGLLADILWDNINAEFREMKDQDYLNYLVNG